MSARNPRIRGCYPGMAIAAILLCAPLLTLWAADAVCPNCEAPLETGAAFCVRCGYKLETVAAPAPAAPDPREIVVQVVTIHDTELTSTLQSLAFETNLRVDSILGSAFAIAPGEFVTESGLLVGAKEVMLRDASGRSFPARVAGSDAMIGVALLRADLPDISVLELRENKPAHAGERLTAIGFPVGLRSVGQPIASAGVVSGLHRTDARIHPIEDYFQTDASLPRGLIGGPILDARGRVVGMSTGFVWGSRVYMGPLSGIGFAIPVDLIRRSIDWIRSGSASRAWLGAYAAAAYPESRDRYGLASRVRLYVDHVFPGSPAEEAGLRRGDGLLKVQGREVTDLTSVQQDLLGISPGDPVTIEVSRGEEILALTVVASIRPERPRLSGLDALRFYGDIELAPNDDKRLVVDYVAPGSELARLDVGPGDVLLSVLSKKDWTHGARDNSRWRRVRTVDDLEARLETAYSDLDFCLGLRFRARDGRKREMLLWQVLTPTAAL